MLGRVGWGGAKKCKPIPVSSRGAGLKSYPIPALSPLWDRKNSHGTKRERTGQAGRGKIAIPNLAAIPIPQWGKRGKL